MADALDFTGKTVLVVGGSSGIGNGIAQGFRKRGATVHVWGTRAKVTDYSLDEGSDLNGLHYAQVDVSDSATIDTWRPNFRTLDVLVLSQAPRPADLRATTLEPETRAWFAKSAFSMSSFCSLATFRT